MAKSIDASSDTVVLVVYLVVIGTLCALHAGMGRHVNIVAGVPR